jgi:hypothetical protein
MKEKLYFSGKPSFRIVMLIFIACVLFLGIFPIGIMDRDPSIIPFEFIRSHPDRVRLMFYTWLVITSPATLYLLYKFIGHHVVITDNAMKKGLFGRWIPFEEIARFGEAEIKAIIRSGYSQQEVYTRHMAVLDKKGKQARINWMTYSNGGRLAQLLRERLGQPEEMDSNMIGRISFRE